MSLTVCWKWVYDVQDPRYVINPIQIIIQSYHIFVRGSSLDPSYSIESLLPSTALGVGVGLPSLAGRIRVPTKPLRFRPVLPLPSQLSFNSLLKPSIFSCASSPLWTLASTLTHCNIRPTISVTWALSNTGRERGDVNEGNSGADVFDVALLRAPSEPPSSVEPCELKLAKPGSRLAAVPGRRPSGLVSVELIPALMLSRLSLEKIAFNDS